MRITEQRLGHRLHHARLARSSRPQKKQVPHRTSRSVQAGQKHLVNLGDLFDRLVLTHDATSQSGFKLPSISAAAVRIEHGSKVRSHKVVSFSLPCPNLSCSRLYGSAFACFSLKGS